MMAREPATPTAWAESGMRESSEQLLLRIRLGKDGAIEFREAAFSGGKIAEPGRNELADELAAFANARGGVLVLGVFTGERVNDVHLSTAERQDARGRAEARR